MLGLDDKLIIALGFVALLVLGRIIFWLKKIYNRVKGISKDLGHIAIDKQIKDGDLILIPRKKVKEWLKEK